jgi:hypothetical protein
MTKTIIMEVLNIFSYFEMWPWSDKSQARCVPVGCCWKPWICILLYTNCSDVIHRPWAVLYLQISTSTLQEQFQSWGDDLMKQLPFVICLAPLTETRFRLVTEFICIRSVGRNEEFFISFSSYTSCLEMVSFWSDPLWFFHLVVIQV